MGGSPDFSVELQCMAQNEKQVAYGRLHHFVLSVASYNQETNKGVLVASYSNQKLMH